MNSANKALKQLTFIYDFDGTLIHGTTEDNAFIPKIAQTKTEFWQEVHQLSKENDMDSILAYMYLAVKKSIEYNSHSIHRGELLDHGREAPLFDGLLLYFDRINHYALEHNVNLQHYIISSGDMTMIAGTPIARKFERIYGSSYLFDEKNFALWPSMVMNYSNKVQFLTRISKGIDNSWDNSAINHIMSVSQRPIPFDEMVYLGDGLTDVPAMRLVKGHGGKSIGVYDPKTGDQSVVNSLMQEYRLSHIAPADYNENSELDLLLKKIIREH